MSSFSGKFVEQEFCDIAIDNFLPHNRNASAFFLSHLHTDHMKGIEDPFFHLVFNQKEVYLYCSLITKKLLLLKEQVKIPEHKIIVLDKHGNDIHVNDGRRTVRVTYLPAGHCPGSIMLLFEGFNKRILYTGDFRLSMSDLQKMKPLHSPGNEVLPIHSLYFDSTFAHADWETFPSREESLKNLKDAIFPWLDEDPANRVRIWQPAYIGMEYLMIELGAILNPPKIHVSEKMYEQFLSVIDPLVDFLTTKSDESRVHFCYSYCGQGCPRDIFNKTMKIHLSILKFTSELQESRGLCYYEQANTLKIAYSSHSSYKEVRDFISYLNPGKIYPCVLPRNSEITLDELAERVMLDIKKDHGNKKENDVKPIHEVINDFVSLSPTKKRKCESFPGMESPPI